MIALKIALLLVSIGAIGYGFVAGEHKPWANILAPLGLIGFLTAAIYILVPSFF